MIEKPMAEAIISILADTVKITLIVFALMVFIEYFHLRYYSRLRGGLTGPRWVQYVVASALGVVPGCVGTFFVVSLYVRGLTTFGALVAVLLATSGDGAFVMLAKIPATTPLLFGICGVVGVAAGFAADALIDRLNVTLCQECRPEVHDEDVPDAKFSISHFARDHIYNHIIRQHLVSLFLWLLGAFVVLRLVTPYMDVTGLPVSHVALMFIAAGIGILPESGAHLVFVLLFAEGAIPFSVLLTISLVQDGHGLLPLLSASVRDAVYVSVLTAVVGLIVGFAVMAMGY